MLPRPREDRFVIVNWDDPGAWEPVYNGLGKRIIERRTLDIQVGKIT
jgi:hypothetical protein